MNYQQIRPSAAVGGFVSCYWTLEDDSPSLPSVQRIVPDGCPELILNLGTPFESQHDGRWASQPEYFFAGQITGPMLVRPSGPARMIGIRFRPYGATRLLKLPIHALTGLVVPLADLSPTLHQHLEPLRELSSMARQLADVDQVLQRFAEKSDEADCLVAAAVNDIIRADTVPDVSNVAALAGLSLRQFQRRFKDEVGIAPKLFCRIQRFQRVFQSLDSSRSTWVNTAIQCGYYDQAHLIRDFRDFSGEPPVALLAAESDLAAHFLQHQAMSRFSKTVAVSSL
jgi:AraC-like DNA-binding protein